MSKHRKKAPKGPFYHVNIHDLTNLDTGLMKFGQEYTVGAVNSSFWMRPHKFVWTPNLAGEHLGVIDYFTRVADGQVEDDEWKARLVPFAAEMLKGARELVWEQERIRGNPYSSKPSRLKCLFASESREDAKTWAEVVLAEGRGQNARNIIDDQIAKMPAADQPKAHEKFRSVGSSQLVELMVEGEVFVADANWVEHDWIPIEQMEKRAQSYWAGERHSTPKLEVLIRGKVRVTKTSEL